MNAKMLYESIIKMIHNKEIISLPDAEICVYLPQYSKNEVIEIGRSGDEYLFFTFIDSQRQKSTYLIPSISPPIVVVVAKNPSQNTTAAAKKTIGFLGNIADSH